MHVINLRTLNEISSSREITNHAMKQIYWCPEIGRRMGRDARFITTIDAMNTTKFLYISDSSIYCFRWPKIHWNLSHWKSFIRFHSIFLFGVVSPSGVTHLQAQWITNTSFDLTNPKFTTYILIFGYTIVVLSLFAIIITHNFRSTSLKLSSITPLRCLRQLYNGIFVYFFFILSSSDSVNIRT